MALIPRRQHIREQTVAILQAAGTLAADRVYPTPILPWRRERPLPAIGVYTLDERGVALDGKGNSGPFTLRKSCELVIELLVELPTEASLPAGATPEERAADAEARLRLDTQAPLDALYGQVMVALLCNPEWYVPIGSFPPPLFDGLEASNWHAEIGRVEATDRRTIAGTITNVLTYGCVAEPSIHDDFVVAFFDVDVIDPAADPNIKYPGPDGRIEVSFTAPGPVYVTPFDNGGDPHAG